MELHEFITATLVDIQRGVHAAIEQAKGNKWGGVINPVWGGDRQIGAAYVQEVEFDIAVSASEKTAGKADAGIKVWEIGVGGEAEIADENSKVNRIKFVVPIVPPTTNVNNDR